MDRHAVTTTVFVEAADAGEAALIVEREPAGRFDNELVSVSAHAAAADGPRCPACGSERIEHHEDIVARRHFRHVRDDGVLVFDGFTDSFDDDGMRPRLWCGDCSLEWDLPEGGWTSNDRDAGLLLVPRATSSAAGGRELRGRDQPLHPRPLSQ